jgi:hypothetical protein
MERRSTFHEEAEEFQHGAKEEGKGEQRST